MLITQSEVVHLMDVHVAAMESGINKVEAVSHFLTDLTSAGRNLTRALRNECDHMERCNDLIVREVGSSVVVLKLASEECLFF